MQQKLCPTWKCRYSRAKGRNKLHNSQSQTETIIFTDPQVIQLHCLWSWQSSFPNLANVNVHHLLWLKIPLSHVIPLLRHLGAAQGGRDFFVLQTLHQTDNFQEQHQVIAKNTSSNAWTSTVDNLTVTWKIDFDWMWLVPLFKTAIATPFYH